MLASLMMTRILQCVNFNLGGVCQEFSDPILGIVLVVRRSSLPGLWVYVSNRQLSVDAHSYSKDTVLNNTFQDTAPDNNPVGPHAGKRTTTPDESCNGGFLKCRAKCFRVQARSPDFASPTCRHRGP